MVSRLTLALAAGAMLVAGAAQAAITQVPKRTPDRYSADQAFFAYVLTPETFCRSIGLRYVRSGPGCGGMIVHDHADQTAGFYAFIGKNGGNFIAVGDEWWDAIRAGNYSASFLQIVIAHEEGHLICGHVRGPVTAYNEMVADRLAGAAMRLIWQNQHYTTKQVNAMIWEAYRLSKVDAVHAAIGTRIGYFVEGYLDPGKAVC